MTTMASSPYTERQETEDRVQGEEGGVEETSKQGQPREGGGKEGREGEGDELPGDDRLCHRELDVKTTRALNLVFIK